MMNSKKYLLVFDKDTKISMKEPDMPWYMDRICPYCGWKLSLYCCLKGRELLTKQKK